MISNHKLLLLMLAAALTTNHAFADNNSDEIENFIRCEQPFFPTSRIKKLYIQDIIRLKSTNTRQMDGAPHFKPVKAVQAWGFEVISIAGFDADNWDKTLYHRAPGTLTPTFVSISVLASKKELENKLKPHEKMQYFLSEQKKWFSDWISFDNPKNLPITEITCWKDKASPEKIEPQAK